ncbi:MAG: sulfite exporter TauE/SafE family protein [bacterium]|nr:sulfite exporter TauE/SafE family protein [bacterium]
MEIVSLVTWVTGGFLTGVTTGVACVAVCGAVLVPVVLSRRETVVRNVLVLGWFSLGRLCTYVIFGGVCGWVGSIVHEHEWFRWVQPGAHALAGIVLLRFIAGRGRGKGECVSLGERVPAQVPFVLGMITGANICPPFVSAIVAALGCGSVVYGVLYFVAFFLGTTIYLLPLPVVGCLARWGRWRQVGRISGAVVGMVYVYLGLAGWHEQLHSRHEEISVMRSGEEMQVPEEVGKFMPYATHAARLVEGGQVVSVLRDGELVGYAVDSRELGVRKIGYGGPTPVVLVTDARGRVVGIEILPNGETPGFLQKVRESGWWRGLVGRRVEELLRVLEGPEVVAGATLTTESLREHVREAAKAVHRHLEKERWEGLGAGDGWRAVVRGAVGWVPAAVICIAAVFAGRGRVMRRPVVRWAIWVAAIVLLGFYRANYFSMAQVGAAIRKAWPGVEGVGWHVVFWFALLSPLWWGRVYCQYVCPFGALSEVLGRVSPWSWRMPHEVGRWLRYAKFVVLMGAVIWVICAGSPAVERLEPFQAVFVDGQARAYVGFGVATLIVSVVVKRFWCNFLCPDGALFEVIERFRWRRER